MRVPRHGRTGLSHPSSARPHMFRAQGLRFDIPDRARPRTGGAVLVSNHIGYLDFVFAGLAALPSKRLVRFMAKKAMFGHRVCGPLMRA